MWKYILDVKYALILLLSFGSIQVTLADFYVIPVNKKIKNVVTVAKSGAQFTDIKVAIDSITDANATNSYVIRVEPGIYMISEPIQLKPYVDVIGSGQKSTQIKGSISNSIYDINSSIFIGDDNTSLSHLSIDNLGDSDWTFGVLNLDASPNLYKVTINISGTGVTTGVYNKNYSYPTLNDINISVTGGTYSSGVFSEWHSSPILNEVNIEVSGASERNSGISVYGDSMILIQRSIIKGTDHDVNYASTTPFCFDSYGTSGVKLNSDCTRP